MELRQKMKISQRNDKRYPYKVVMNDRKILIPQQKQFGEYCRHHGCSVTACSIALQFLCIKQDDDTVWNPKEVYQYAKEHIPGYNGSKLSIWGCKSLINKIAGHEVAFWHSNDGKNNPSIRGNIDKHLRAGHVILFEEKGPVHTVALLGIDSKDRYIVATNGKVVRRSRAGQIRKGLHGFRGAKNQKNWWGGRDHGAGYVIIKGDK